MAGQVMKDGLLGVSLAVVFWAAPARAVAEAQDDAKDWPMYNRDVLGTRHNRAETTIDKSNAGRLEEKWRFPAKGSDLEIGVIHATPVVVDGYVYFGTATDPTFYKLTPDGKVKWSYRNPARIRPDAPAKDDKAGKARFLSLEGGILGSALVTKDSVFFGDADGWFYALDRATGKERWNLNTRGKEFPGAAEQAERLLAVVGEPAAGGHHAAGAAADLPAALHELEIGAAGGADLSGRADGGLRRHFRALAPRHAVQHLGGRRLHRAVWRRRTMASSG